MEKKGTLSARMIEEMIPRFISEGHRKCINQASLDLAITDTIWRVENVFLPNPGESIDSILSMAKKWKHPIHEPLWRGHTYIAKVAGSISLPEGVYGYANPKSSLGRTDAHIRLMADGVSRYDCIPRGWKGNLWVLIQPKSFHIIVAKGMRLNQVRFFNQDTRFGEPQVEKALLEHKLLWDERTKKSLTYKDLKISDRDGSLILLIDLESDIVGYRAKKTETPLDLSRSDADPREFFEEIGRPKNGSLSLEEGDFYILSSLEAVRVPTVLSCEMVPMDERAGEFRSHYAGYIDPGWGYGKSGEGKGRQLTLEVRTFENIVIRKRQPIAKIRFECMTEEAPTYDSKSSNYTKQVGPTLGKFFAPWK